MWARLFRANQETGGKAESSLLSHQVSLSVQVFTQIIWKVIYFLLCHQSPSTQHTQTHSIINFSRCNWQHSPAPFLPHDNSLRISLLILKAKVGPTQITPQVYLDILKFNSIQYKIKCFLFPLQTEMYTIFPLRKLQSSLDRRNASSWKCVIKIQKTLDKLWCVTYE